MSLVVSLVAALMVSQQPVVMENRTTARRPESVGAGAGEARTERVCSYERVTGSNLSRRVCRNRAVAAQAQNDSRDGLRRLQGSRMPDGR